ncbi:MAG: DNA helicase RecQ [Muribaculaceae bacterium]|nr:DNA helicase RecQ [Muribaculaceae bacterium]
MQDLERRALAVLKKFYGYESFHPMQYEVIEHVMGGNDCVVLMPTGGGKSLCYQIPALLKPGCAIVVSPLLALMKDQVDSLIANGVPAAAINSQQSEAQNREIMENVFKQNIKLLYVSPERLIADMDQWSSDMLISLIAIDEAHCISHWGHDFRPEYTQLGLVKERFPGVPIMALTATADRLTRIDLREQLGIGDAKMFIKSFDRPNISLSVVSGMSGREKLKRIVNFIEAHKGQSGIVYCLSRKNTEDMAKSLSALGINAQAFHAGMPTEKKLRIQRDFINDDLQVICATIAFGMGIDKSNVRWIIHSNMPKNIENYYQEVGRAGRDGMKADALMFYSFGDVKTLMSFANDSGQAMVNIEKLSRMQQFAEATVCRRRMLLSYFNERYDHDCGNCDVCNDPPERFDGTTLCQMALSAMVRTDQNIGFKMLIDILRGSRKSEIIAHGYDKIKTYGVGHDYSNAMWNAYLLQMLQMGLIYIAYEDDEHLKITSYGNEVLYGKRQVMLSRFYYDNYAKKPVKKAAQSIEFEGDVDMELLEKLKLTRRAIAKAHGIAPYMVFSDKVLMVMAQEKPTTKAQFGTLYGVGEFKTNAYWLQFTAVIKEHLKK